MLGYSTIDRGLHAAGYAVGRCRRHHGQRGSAYGAAMFYVITYALATLVAFGTMLLLSRQGFEAEEISICADCSATLA